MNIDTIKNGYVNDHITAGNAMKIYKLLELEGLDCQVALITNAKSKKTKVKDLIKVAKLIDLNFDKIACVDPNVTINIVKNDKIIEKKQLSQPEKLVNVFKCNNPRCIKGCPVSIRIPEFIKDFLIGKMHEFRYMDRVQIPLKSHVLIGT